MKKRAPRKPRDNQFFQIEFYDDLIIYNGGNVSLKKAKSLVRYLKQFIAWKSWYEKTKNKMRPW